MTAAVLDDLVTSKQVWLQLHGVAVTDLRRNGIDVNASQVLRRQLERGAAVDPDPRRENFFETTIDGCRYYFHVVSRRGPGTKVWLLARWPEA